MFNITSDTMSYRFLARWNSKIKKFNSSKYYYNYLFPRTFCQYYRMVLATVLKLLAFGVVSFALVPYAIYDIIYGIMTVGLNEHFIGLTILGAPTIMQSAFVFGLLGTIGYTAVAFVFFIGFIIQWIGEIADTLHTKYTAGKPEKTKDKKEPSFFAMAYSAYKNKFCPMVNFVPKEEIEDEHAN